MKNSQIIFNAVVVLLVVFAALQVEESCATSEDDDSFEKRLIGGNNALWALDSFARVVSAQQREILVFPTRVYLNNTNDDQMIPL